MSPLDQFFALSVRVPHNAGFHNSFLNLQLSRKSKSNFNPNNSPGFLLINICSIAVWKLQCACSIMANQLVISAVPLCCIKI